SGAPPGSGGGCRADRDALVGKQLLQLAGLEHLADDVAAADELALDVKLRNGRPVGIGLDAVAQIGGFEDIQALIADPDVIENLHHLPGKTALRKLRRPLHKQYDVVRLHFVVDKLFDAHIRVLLRRSPRAGISPLNPKLLYMYPKPLCIQSKMAGSRHSWAKAPTGPRKARPDDRLRCVFTPQ